MSSPASRLGRRARSARSRSRGRRTGTAWGNEPAPSGADRVGRPVELPRLGVLRAELLLEIGHRGDGRLAVAAPLERPEAERLERRALLAGANRPRRARARLTPLRIRRESRPSARRRRTHPRRRRPAAPCRPSRSSRSRRSSQDRVEDDLRVAASRRALPAAAGWSASMRCWRGSRSSVDRGQRLEGRAAPVEAADHACEELPAVETADRPLLGRAVAVRGAEGRRVVPIREEALARVDDLRAVVGRKQALPLRAAGSGERQALIPALRAERQEAGFQ